MSSSVYQFIESFSLFNFIDMQYSNCEKKCKVLVLTGKQGLKSGVLNMQGCLFNGGNVYLSYTQKPGSGSNQQPDDLCYLQGQTTPGSPKILFLSQTLPLQTFILNTVSQLIQLIPIGNVTYTLQLGDFCEDLEHTKSLSYIDP